MKMMGFFSLNDVFLRTKQQQQKKEKNISTEATNVHRLTSSSEIVNETRVYRTTIYERELMQ